MDNSRYDGLNANDKLFMILNKNNFDLSLSSYIDFHTKEWMTEINKENHEEIKIEQGVHDHIMSLCDEINIKFFKYSTIESSVVSKICSFRKMMEKTDFTSLTSIFEFVHWFNNTIVKEWKRNKGNQDMSDLIQKRKTIVTVYGKILPYKLRAYSIYNKYKQSYGFMDNTLVDYCNYTISMLLSNVVQEKVTPEYMAFNIFMFLDLCEEEITSMSVVQTFIENFGYISGILTMSTDDGKQVYDILKHLVNTKSDEIDFTKEIANLITDDMISDNPEYLSAMKDKILTDSFVKLDEDDDDLDVCSILNNDSIIVGSNELPDDVSLVKVVSELHALDPDTVYEYISQYVDDGDMDISFTLDNDTLQRLKDSVNDVNNKRGICKIVDKQGQFYSIIKDNGTSYCMFNINNKPDIVYGLSFPPSFNGARKFISIDLK